MRLLTGLELGNDRIGLLPSEDNGYFVGAHIKTTTPVIGNLLLVNQLQEGEVAGIHQGYEDALRRQAPYPLNGAFTWTLGKHLRMDLSLAGSYIPQGENCSLALRANPEMATPVKFVQEVVAVQSAGNNIGNISRGLEDPFPRYIHQR